jgi:hypothetical protein
MNAHQDGDTHYLSYMLRMWCTRDSKGQPLWRASLEEPGNHQRASFGDVRSLFAFLQSRVGVEQNRDTAQGEPLAGSTSIDGG